MPKVLKKTVDIGHEMEYMLATGNLRSRSGLGLQQVKCATLILLCCVLETFVGENISVLDGPAISIQYH